MVDKKDTPFVKYKSKQVVAWTLINMRQAHRYPYALGMGRERFRPFEGRTVIVCGAGPSLAGHESALKAAAEKGIPIIATNSACAPIEKLGIVPEVMVLRESLRLDDVVSGSKARRVAIEIGVHPETWNACDGRGIWWIPGYPRHYEISRFIGVQMLYGGTAALTSAVALARQWGASTIVLVGCDLSVSKDGRTYHPDTERGDLVGTPIAPGAMQFDGNKINDARCRETGQKEQPKNVVVAGAVSWDNGDELSALLPWQDQRNWLATEGQRSADTLTRYNAVVEGMGTGIPMWRNLTDLAKFVKEQPSQDEVNWEGASSVPGHTALEWLQMTMGQIRGMREIQKEIGRPSGPRLQRLINGGAEFTWLKQPPFVTGCKLAESLAGHRLVDGSKINDERQRHAFVQNALLEALALAEHCLTGNPAELVKEIKAFDPPETQAAVTGNGG